MTERKNLVASILARLKNIAKENDVVYGEILARYAIERVLKRIELSEYASKCILKGGSLFILWTEGFNYRPTMDADLEFRGDGSPTALKAMFKSIAKIAVDDGISIDDESIDAAEIREDDEYGGVRVTMMGYLGKVRIPVQFDVGIGDAITPAPKKFSFPALLDLPAPKLKIYPRETVIAEKYETIVKRGLANSRMKDYYDLWVLSNDPMVDKEIAKLAIERTFSRRKQKLPETCPDGLVDSFAENKIKLTQWDAFLRKNRLDVGPDSFLDVVRQVRGFIEAILGRINFI